MTLRIFFGAVAAGSDAENPSQVTNVGHADLTHNAYTLSWDVATDNVGVTGYEYQIGTETIVDAGAGLSEAIIGRSPGVTDTVKVRAYDAAGNRGAWSATHDVTLQSLRIAPTIKDPTNDTARASQTGLGVLVLGEKPGGTATPTVLASASTGTTDGSGVLDIGLNSSGKNPGDIVWLVLVKSDGVPANAGYSVCWPVAVEAV